MRPSLHNIRKLEALYRWGHPFSIQIRNGVEQHVLSSPNQLPAAFAFLVGDPVPISNWLDTPIEYRTFSRDAITLQHC